VKILPLGKMLLVSLLSAAIYVLFGYSVMVALPLYGLLNHFTNDEASYFLTAFVICGIILLYIIGRLADRVLKHRLLLLISLNF